MEKTGKVSEGALAKRFASPYAKEFRRLAYHSDYTPAIQSLTRVLRRRATQVAQPRMKETLLRLADNCESESKKSEPEATKRKFVRFYHEYVLMRGA